MPDLAAINVILGFGLVLDLGLGTLLYYLDKRRAANQLFSVWMIGLASWTVTILGFYNAEGAADALLWMRAAYVVAIITILAFWYFATQFPEERRLHPIVHVANALTLALFGYLIMSTDLIVAGVAMRPWADHVRLNPTGWWIYATYLLFYFVSAHVLLIRSWMRATGTLRTQLLFVIAGVFVGAELGGAFFNLILPSPIFRNWDYIWLGPTASTMFVVPFTAYAVARYRMFTVKGMLTQIAVGYLVVLTATDFLFSRSAFDLVFRASVAVGVAGFGIMLIRRINGDERRKRELERLTVDLERANAELRELDRAKSEFINIASHQLRTPVSVIKGYLSLMEEGAYGELPAKAREKVRQMFEMNERLVHLISNFLNLSRIEKKRIEFSIAPTDIAASVVKAVDVIRSEAAVKRTEVIVGVPDAPLPLAFADAEKLDEVLVNLLDNAVKYSPEESRISVRAEADDHLVTVRITDTGIGLTDDERERLFEKYYRARSADMPNQQGSGLGLYICRTFVEGMGGRIWVDESAKGKGTTFALSLPVASVR